MRQSPRASYPPAPSHGTVLPARFPARGAALLVARWAAPHQFLAPTTTEPRLARDSHRGCGPQSPPSGRTPPHPEGKRRTSTHRHQYGVSARPGSALWAFGPECGPAPYTRHAAAGTQRRRPRRHHHDRQNFTLALVFHRRPRCRMHSRMRKARSVPAAPTRHSRTSRTWLDRRTIGRRPAQSDCDPTRAVRPRATCPQSDEPPAHNPTSHPRTIRRATRAQSDEPPAHNPTSHPHTIRPRATRQLSRPGTPKPGPARNPARFRGRGGLDRDDAPQQLRDHRCREWALPVSMPARAGAIYDSVQGCACNRAGKRREAPA